LTYSSGCSLLLGTCESAPVDTTYSTPELPGNPLDSRLQPPGTVLQYTEGAQNYQYAYPNSTFDESTQSQTPPQNESSPAIANPGNMILGISQWLSQEFSALFR
jgi:hypothetical protein